MPSPKARGEGNKGGTDFTALHGKVLDGQGKRRALGGGTAVSDKAPLRLHGAG